MQDELVDLADADQGDDVAAVGPVLAEQLTGMSRPSLVMPISVMASGAIMRSVPVL
jgi:hypothetical protein